MLNKDCLQTMSIVKKLRAKIKDFVSFYIKALQNIDQEYNLVLENIIFSPKYQQQVPILRLLGSGGYIIEPAINILKHSSYKYHLHPDDLLKINELSATNILSQNTSITQQDISGDIILSNGETLNIHQNNLSKSDLDKLFSLPQEDIVKLIEQRGLQLGRKVSLDINHLKQAKRTNNIKTLKLVKGSDS